MTYFNILNFFINFILKSYLFIYIYSFFYKSCNIYKKIKIHGKNKIIYQPKSTLGFIYFSLLLMIFNIFTFRVIAFLFLTISLSLLILCDTFVYNLNDKLKGLNKKFVIILCWKIFHAFLTVVYTVLNPINNIITNSFQKKFLIVKKFFNAVVNLETSESKNYDDINKKILQHKSDDTTNISEFIVNSKKQKSKSKMSITKKINENNSETDCNDDLKIENLNSDIQKLIEKIANENSLNSSEQLSCSNIQSNSSSSSNSSLNLNANANSNTNSKSLSTSKSIKDDFKEKLNNINNIFNNVISEDLEDITATEISKLD